MGDILRLATQTRAMSSKAVLSLCLSLCLTALVSGDCLTTSGQSCVFPFKYGGVTYNTCTTAGGFAPWCSTQVDSSGVHIAGNYGDCTAECLTTTTTTTTTAAPGSECVTTGGNVVGAACVFPFSYGGVAFTSCTTSGGFAPWCYTEVNSQGVGVTGKYGDCGTSLACTGETTTTSTTTTSTTTAVDVCVASCVDTCSATTTSTTSTTTTSTTSTTTTRTTSTTTTTTTTTITFPPRR